MVESGQLGSRESAYQAGFRKYLDGITSNRTSKWWVAIALCAHVTCAHCAVTCCVQGIFNFRPGEEVQASSEWIEDAAPWHNDSRCGKPMISLMLSEY